VPRLSRYEFNQEYVERLIAEDPEVERHFAGYFTDLLRLKLRSRLRSPALVEDAVQETLTRVLVTLKGGGLQSAERLGAFVNAVCNNVLLETYRSGARTSPLEDEYDQADERTASAETEVVRAEDHARVRDVLAELPQREQDVLRWLFFEDRDKDDVCQTLEVDRNYLRVLLHRAKVRFRERLLERTQ